jgi:copper chaperone CopZ
LVLGLSAGAAEAKLASVTSRFEVQGMVCESCARDVREGLSKLPGVRGIAVDVKTGIVTVIYEAKRLNARRIAKAIDDYGFTVRDLTR